ncbi:universal stress protein [bacterium]|nr:MAG: universal stress protein [bacterium]
MSLRKLLFSTRLEEFSLRAVESLYSLREAGLEEMIFLNVVHYDESAVAASYGFDKHIADELSESARLRFVEWEKRVAAEGLSARHVIELGRVEDKIIEVACREGVDLIVLGERRSLPLDSVYLGGVPMGVARRSPIPVMIFKSPEAAVAHPLNPRPLKTIIYCTDFSEVSDLAYKFLKRLSGAVDKVEIVNLLTDDDFAAHDPEEIRTVEEGRLKLMEGMAAELLELGVLADTHIYAGDAAREIITVCAERDATAILMGTTGRRGVVEAVKGSLSHRVVEKSPVPVILVPLPKKTACE